MPRTVQQANKLLYKQRGRKKKPILTQPEKVGLKAIRVRLDAKTVITVASQKALESWKERYPKLEVIG